jgi:alkylation response protein AidB-like acyl-CoA dehydrogenase
MTTVDTLLDHVKQITPILRAHADENESTRQLARPVVAAMQQAGLYRMARPRAFGGLELDPVSMFQVVEAVARHDSAAGWNLQLSLAVDWFLAWLPDAGAAEILAANPDAVLGTSFTPTCQAIEVEGGYRLTGQIPYVSGAYNCHWLMFTPILMDGDQPRLHAPGIPMQRFMWLPAADAGVLDTWHTLGMRGTGSHDVAVHDLFIPEQRTAPLAPLGQPGTAYQGPLYRLTVWPPIALLAPPALGVAQAALDDLIEMAGKKTPRYTAAPMRDRQVVQRQVAEAAACLGAGRAFLHEAFRENWEAANQGAELTLERKLQMQLAATYAVQAAAKAVDLLHEAAGASAIRNQYRGQRYFRDIHTITQHAFICASRYESVGALLLGAQSDWPFFAF